MTNYSVNSGSIPAGTSVVNTGTRTDGIIFTVSATCQLTGFQYYVSSGETVLTGSSYSGALYTLTNANTTSGATNVVTSTAGSGTFTSAAWNVIPIVTPYTLSPGVTYLATATHPANLQFLHNYWNSDGGLGGAGGITSGPISAPSAGPTGAQTTLEQPTGTVGSMTSTGSWYGVDVVVSSPGDYSLWEQAPGTGGSSDSNTPGYVLGQSFSLSAACTMNNVWFYSNPSAVSLPGIVAVWTSGGTLLNSNSTPTWSGAAGSGWVSTPLSTSLASGNYVVGVVGKNDGQLWYSITTTGVPAVTNGPISCAANSCLFDGTGDGVLRFPGSGFGSDNIWVDADVTPSGGTTNISVSDYAGQVESVVIVATVPLSEVAAEAESRTITVTVSLTDSAGQIDAEAESVTLSTADVAAAAESISGLVSLVLSDVAGAAEALQVIHGISDAAGAIETYSITVTGTLNDTGAAFDTIFNPLGGAVNPLKPAIVLVASTYAPVY